MKNLEKWLSDIDVNEPYNDIKDDILDGIETPIHLKKPISTVRLIMPKPKTKDGIKLLWYTM